MRRSDRRRPALAERIRRGDDLIGLIVKMPNPALLEVAGHLGFDFALIDGEHGSADSLELEHHLRAAASVDLDVVVRVGENAPLPVLQALDSGAAGVVVPHVNDAGDATRAVAASHYPPTGSRGLAASTRAGRYSTGTLADHLDRSRRETTVIVQIEDRRAVEHASAIAATAQVDAVWLGPTDLSISFGQPGNPRHPDVVGAVDSIVESVTSVPGAALCVVLDDEAEIGEWKVRGASVFLFVAANLQMLRLRRLLSDAHRTVSPREAPVSPSGSRIPNRSFEGETT